MSGTNQGRTFLTPRASCLVAKFKLSQSTRPWSASSQPASQPAMFFRSVPAGGDGDAASLPSVHPFRRHFSSTGAAGYWRKPNIWLCTGFCPVLRTAAYCGTRSFYHCRSWLTLITLVSLPTFPHVPICRCALRAVLLSSRSAKNRRTSKGDCSGVKSMAKGGLRLLPWNKSL
jgi:hypothetical protein